MICVYCLRKKFRIGWFIGVNDETPKCGKCGRLYKKDPKVAIDTEEAYEEVSRRRLEDDKNYKEWSRLATTLYDLCMKYIWM